MYKYGTNSNKISLALRVLEVREDGSVYREGLLKTPQIRESGYFSIIFNHDGKRIKVRLHRLIIAKFKGIKKDYAVNHIDGDKSNNHISNLEYCTLKDNIRDYWDRGEYHGRIKMRKGDASNIRIMYNSGKRQIKDLAKLYNTDRSYISQIINNRYWKDPSYTRTRFYRKKMEAL